ncbi:hypothetical protein D9611_012409 [Ephemerocybe angulata]|uniref:ATP-citrate synthase citrate-binding domain-containing protein n=1 Tax=Ephemerocybe angulata TaxID=980116 RepID=A0A8H5FK20_9AGAR|nr:hypothetical protein D9611_012409 [Tulosesus angulatus]
MTITFIDSDLDAELDELEVGNDTDLILTRVASTRTGALICSGEDHGPWATPRNPDAVIVLKEEQIRIPAVRIYHLGLYRLHHEGGVDIGDVDAKALVLNITVTSEPFPTRDTLTHVPTENTASMSISTLLTYIQKLDATTGASLKLTVPNADGWIWIMVAGGSASIVYSDAIAAHDLAHYEYSGAPIEGQTYEYAKTIVELITRGTPNPEGKILIISGGIDDL